MRVCICFILFIYSLQSVAGGFLVKIPDEAEVSAWSPQLNSQILLPTDQHLFEFNDENFYYTLIENFPSVRSIDEYQYILPVPKNLSRYVQVFHSNGKDKMRFSIWSQNQIQSFIVTKYQETQDIKWFALISYDWIVVNLNPKDNKGLRVVTNYQKEKSHFSAYTFINNHFKTEDTFQFTFKNNSSQPISFHIPESEKNIVNLGSGKSLEEKLTIRDLSGNLDIFLCKILFEQNPVNIIKSPNSNYGLLNVSAWEKRKIIPEVIFYIELSDRYKQEAQQLIEQIFLEYSQKQTIKFNFVLNNSQVSRYADTPEFLSFENKRRIGQLMNTLQEDLITKNSLSTLVQLLQGKPIESTHRILIWLNDAGISKYSGKPEIFVNSITQANTSKTIIYPYCIGNLFPVEIMHNIAEKNGGKVEISERLSFEKVNQLLNTLTQVTVENLVISQVAKNEFGITPWQGLTFFQNGIFPFEFIPNTPEPFSFNFIQNGKSEKAEFSNINFYSNSFYLKMMRSEISTQTLREPNKHLKSIAPFLSKDKEVQNWLRSEIAKVFVKSRLPIYFNSFSIQEFPKDFGVFSRVNSSLVDNYNALRLWQNLQVVFNEVEQESEEFLRKKKYIDAGISMNDVPNKYVAEKLFVHIPENNFYVDSNILFDSKTTIQTISSKSVEFIKLLQENTGLYPYLSVGKRVALAYGGIIYVISE